MAGAFIDTRIIRPIRPTFGQLFAEGAGEALGKGLVDLPLTLATEGAKYGLIEAPEQRKREAHQSLLATEAGRRDFELYGKKHKEEWEPQFQQERNQLELDRQKALLGTATSRAASKAFLPERVGREIRPEILATGAPQTMEPSPQSLEVSPTRPFWEALRSEAASPEPSTDVAPLVSMGKRFEEGRAEALPEVGIREGDEEGIQRVSRRGGEAAPEQMRTYTPGTTPTDWQLNPERLGPQAYIAPPKYARTAEGRDIVSATTVPPEELAVVGLGPEYGQVEMPLTYEPNYGGSPLGWASLAQRTSEDRSDVLAQDAQNLANMAVSEPDPVKKAELNARAQAAFNASRKVRNLSPLKPGELPAFTKPSTTPEQQASALENNAARNEHLAGNPDITEPERFKLIDEAQAARNEAARIRGQNPSISRPKPWPKKKPGLVLPAEFFEPVK